MEFIFIFSGFTVLFFIPNPKQKGSSMMPLPFCSLCLLYEAQSLREMIFHLSVHQLPESEGDAVCTDDAPALSVDALRCRDLQSAKILIDARIRRRIAAALEIKRTKAGDIRRIQYMAQRMRRLRSIPKTRFRLDAGAETAQAAKLW